MFHMTFPAITVGLSIFLSVVYGLYWRTGRAVYLQMFRFTGRLTAVRTDITRCPAATERYGITGAPSCVLLKEGEAVAHGTGPMTTAEVRKFLDGHL